jgi:hypothetical protein
MRRASTTREGRPTCAKSKTDRTMNYVDLHPIPIRERASIIFLEHAQIDVEDQAFVLIEESRARTQIPIAGLACVMLEPGTRISHAAVALAAIGHSAIALEALAPNGETLADLCFYVDETPAIDQLTAVALHVAAGEEQDIVSAANLITTSPAATGHPIFVQKRSEQAAELADMVRRHDRGEGVIFDNNGNPMPLPRGRRRLLDLMAEGPCFREMAKERDDNYWHETKDIWTEAVQVYMLGPQWRKVMLQQCEAA